MKQPKELPKIFTKSSKTYTQICKTDNVYQYEVADNDPNHENIYFEVFYRRIANAKTFPNGNTMPERILYPNNEAFGNWAWCISRGNDYFSALRIAKKKFSFIDEKKRIKQSA
ncbi:hypothetical protein CLV90_2045 [Maribacter spongiicola]|uniref:Uncharacterized protein n=1 Tax=Maribacter spongiicola TaxID=1206753 RepID=A0A4R7K368_9FLAO|nr:hypothetical protein [Maribacter spongiicola]TDT44966.1 hypothetical protein CLV90_2045 [Maribacter spongiicola]